MSDGTWPPHEMLDYQAHHWLHAERSSTASIAEWMPSMRAWVCGGELAPVPPIDMRRRGWEYLGPVNGRPHSKYLDHQ